MGALRSRQRLPRQPEERRDQTVARIMRADGSRRSPSRRSWKKCRWASSGVKSWTSRKPIPRSSAARVLGSKLVSQGSARLAATFVITATRSRSSSLSSESGMAKSKTTVFEAPRWQI